MNILFLAAYWLGFDLLHKSLVSLGEHEVKLVRYDKMIRITTLVNRERRDFPLDLIVYVGTNGGPVLPSPGDLRSLRNICPVLCISPEASDSRWWWNTLQQQQKHECFDLIVNIDGCEEWPESSKGLTLLTPIDPAPWGEPKPWAERSVICGFSGGVDSGYRPFILKEFGDGITIRDCTPGDTYGDYREFVRDCRITFNMAMNANRIGRHVKGRVLEAGLAQSLLLEDEGSPTNRWFIPGQDYIEWKTGTHAAQLAKFMDVPEAESIAANLRTVILAKHTPKHFWSTVFDRLKDKL